MARALARFSKSQTSVEMRKGTKCLSISFFRFINVAQPHQQYAETEDGDESVDQLDNANINGKNEDVNKNDIKA